MVMDQQILFGLIATGLAIYGYMPYFYGMYRGVTKPHAFSWLIGAILAFIIFGIQWSNGAGPGVWMMGYTACACTAIFIFSLKHLSIHLRKSDWFCLIAALLSIPIWLLLDNALYAVILLTVIVVFGFFPTMRKSWDVPYYENLQYYITSFLKYVFAVAALTNIDLTTALFPTICALLNAIQVILLITRRKTVAPAF